MTPSVNFPGVDYMFVNVNRDPFKDPRVRQALLIGIDRDFLIKAAYQGLGSVGTSPFTNRVPWALPAEVDYRKMYAFDPDRAEKLLDEAGVKRGADGKRFSMNIVYPTSNTDGATAAAAIKAMWAKIGIELTLLPLETTAANKRIYTDRDFDVALAQYSSQGDPALGIARAFVSSSIGRALGNGSGYSNPEIDKMFDEAEVAPNQDARGAIYKKIQIKLAADLPVITLRESEFFDGQSVDVRGLETEESKPMWRDAWLDR
jgi:peptide/nickel transport system substrate-binding protein